jgi:hypothetical protein
VIILTSRSKPFQFERVEVFLSPSVRAMLQKECCDAAKVRVVKRALFITRNSLKSHEEGNLLSPVGNTRAITQKLCTYSSPRFFESPPATNRNYARPSIFDSARRTV